MSIDELNKPMSEEESPETNDSGLQPEPVTTPEPAMPVQQDVPVPEITSQQFAQMEMPLEASSASPAPQKGNGKSKGYKKLSTEIEKLSTEHKAGESYDYRSFFLHAQQVHDLFMKTRDINEAQRKELWDKYRNLYDSVVHLRMEKYPTSAAISAQLRDDTVEMIRLAIHFIEGAYDKTTMLAAREKFKAINNQLVARTKSMYKPDADYCWQAFRKCKEQLEKKAETLHSSAMEEAKGFLATALHAFENSANPFEAMNIVIEERNKTKDLILSKEDTDEIVKAFNELWSRLAAKLDEFKVQRRSKREARNAKRKQRREVEQANLTRDAERLDKLTKLITTIESEISDLEGKRDSASSEEYRVKVESWIESKKRKLTEFSAVVAGLKAKVNVPDKETTAVSGDVSGKAGGAE